MGKIKEKNKINVHAYKYLPAVLALSFAMSMPAMADTETSLPAQEQLGAVAQTDEFAEFEETEEAEPSAKTVHMNVSVSLDDESIETIGKTPVVVDITSERLNASEQANVELADGVLNEENGYTRTFDISSDVGIYVKTSVYGDDYDRYHITYDGFDNETFFGDELNGYVYLEPKDGTYTLHASAVDAKAEESVAETLESSKAMNEQQIKDVLSGKYKEEKESSIAEESAAEADKQTMESQPSKLIRIVAVTTAVGLTCLAAVFIWAKKIDPFGRDDGEY